jgi:hypothetical protein
MIRKADARQMVPMCVARHDLAITAARCSVCAAATPSDLRVVERSLLLHGVMSHEQPAQEERGIEEQGAMEEQMQKIDAIVGDEVLGYDGSGREEHSGQTSTTDPRSKEGLEDRLADNRPEQMK